MGARKIVSGLLGRRTPRNIPYPLWHALVYRWFLRFLPDILYAGIFGLYLKIESARKGNDGEQNTSVH
jgi:hypothetical protein